MGGFIYGSAFFIGGIILLISSFLTKSGDGKMQLAAVGTGFLLIAITKMIMGEDSIV